MAAPVVLLERPEETPASVPTFDAATNLLTRRGRELLGRVLSDRATSRKKKEILGARRGLDTFQNDVADLERKIENLQQITRKWQTREEE